MNTTTHQIDTSNHTESLTSETSDSTTFSQYLRSIISVWLADQFRLYRLRQQIKQERKTLESLSDSMLNDIGVSRGDADLECRRKFKDIPLERLYAPGSGDRLYWLK